MAARAAKGKLRVGVVQQVGHFEPSLVGTAEDAFVLRQVFEAPYGLLPGAADLQPLLFDGPLVQPDPGDGLLVEGRLREGLFFSDGCPVTAQDVARAAAGAAVIRRQVSDVRANGDRVSFHLNAPDARFDFALSHLHAAVNRASGGRLLGTGPFMRADDARPDEIRMVRNPYHRCEVTFDELTFRVFQPDEKGVPRSLLQALERGEVDLTCSLTRDDVANVSGVRKLLRPGSSSAALFFNVEQPWLSDVDARHGLALAIDRLEVARSCYTNALAYVANSLLPRGFGDVDDRLRFDRPRAKDLLAKVGPPPRPLRLLLAWGARPYLPRPLAAARAIVAQLGQVGVPVEIGETENSGVFLERAAASDYDLALVGWIADNRDTADYVEANLASNRVPTKNSLGFSGNYGRLRSPDMDAALARYRARRERQDLVAIMEQLDREAPLVPLMYGASITAAAFDVDGIEPIEMYNYPLTGLTAR